MAIKIENKIVGYSVKKPEDTEQPKQEAEPVIKPKLKRPQKLSGDTYKLKNGAENYNLYVTINYLDGEPFELFYNGSHTENDEWIKFTSRIISSMLRNPEYSLEFIAEEMLKITGSKGYFAGKQDKYVNGIVQHTGKLLMRIAKENRGESITHNEVSSSSTAKSEPKETGQECPSCHYNTLIKEGGCTRCTNEDCSYLGECG